MARKILQLLCAYSRFGSEGRERTCIMYGKAVFFSRKHRTQFDRRTSCMRLNKPFPFARPHGTCNRSHRDKSFAQWLIMRKAPVPFFRKAQGHMERGNPTTFIVKFFTVEWNKNEEPHNVNNMQNTFPFFYLNDLECFPKPSAKPWFKSRPPNCGPRLSTVGNQSLWSSMHE